MSRIQTILVATDFSADADRAVARAARLADEHRASLEILHVVDRQELVEAQALQGVPADLRGRVVADARGQLSQLRAGISTVIEVTLSVRVGAPRAEILKASAAVDLLVLGAQGTSPIRDLLLGTTAERILNKARVPILIVKGLSSDSYKRVLAPVDFSPHSQRALELATRVSATAIVTAVHAHIVPYEGYLRLGGSTAEQIAGYRAQEKREAEAQLRELLDALSANHVSVHGVVAHGHPAPVIMQMAEQTQADLVVIGKRGRSALVDAFIGSVTRRTIANARCDVLVLPSLAK